jgi:hypothetical protein
MERVARSVVRQTPLSAPRLGPLAQKLKFLVRSRLAAEGHLRKSVRIGKEADRAWLQMSSRISPAAIQSLVERVVEHAGRMRGKSGP